VYVWKIKGEKLTSREVQDIIKFEGGSLMVWGCIGWNDGGFSVRWRGGCMLNSMWPFWREDCYRTWKILEFLQMKSFSSKIMI
jgi:hypothetical protein